MKIEEVETFHATFVCSMHGEKYVFIRYGHTCVYLR